MATENRAEWTRIANEAAAAFIAVGELCRKGEAKAADDQLTATYKNITAMRQEIEEYIRPLPEGDPVAKELQANVDTLLEVENTLEDELASLTTGDEGDEDSADLDEAADVCDTQASLLEELEF